MCRGGSKASNVARMTGFSTLVRATHLLTNAAWFGGSLMGAVALNPASHTAGGDAAAARIAGAGWQRWGPVQGGAIGLHLLSGLGIIADNRRRTVLHRPTRNAVVLKTGLTGLALAATAAAWSQGRKLAEQRDPLRSADADPAAAVSASEAELDRRMDWLQWAVPVTTGGLLVLDSYLGEQQRGPAGLLDRLGR